MKSLLRQIALPALVSLWTAIMCAAFSTVHAQMPDSLLQQYHSGKSIEEKTKALGSYFVMIGQNNQTVAGKIAGIDSLRQLFVKEHDLVGTDYCLYMIGNYYRLNGSYELGLRYILPVLPHFEERKDSVGIIRCLSAIGACFTNSDNYEQGLLYSKRAEPIAQQFGDANLYCGLLNNLGDIYNRLNQPDSALPYLQKAITLTKQLTPRQTLQLQATVYSTIGQTYLKLQDHALARLYLARSEELCPKIPDPRTLANVENSLSESFFQTKEYDSSIAKARLAFASASPDYKRQMMMASEWLYRNYERLQKFDSTSKYFRVATDLRDSMFSAEKNRSLQSMNFQEQVRVEEAETRKEKEWEERQLNIQYALIALGIVVVIGLFLLLSRSMITNTRVIDLFGIVVLLLVFEFLNLLLHPFLERITHHSPLLMLLCLVGRAAILAPLHHRLEKWTTRKLVQKNKEIRLKAAKKTIERLGEKGE